MSQHRERCPETEATGKSCSWALEDEMGFERRREGGEKQEGHFKCGTCSIAKSCLTLCNPRDYSPVPLGFSRLPCWWDFPGKSSGVGCHCLLQRIFPTQGSNLHLLHWRQILTTESPGKPRAFQERLPNILKICLRNKYIILLIYGKESSQIKKIKSRMTVARERGSGDFLMGTELHHEKMKSLEIDDGGGGTTMWVYLVTLNCTFKMLFYVININI